MADLSALERSAGRLEGLDAQAAAERDTRNLLIRELMDQGCRYKEVARAARMTVSGVQAVLRGD